MSSTPQLANLAVSETGFVFDPSTGATFTVNPTGLVVLRALRDGATVARIVELLEAGFADASRTARDEVLDFVQLLRGHGLLSADFEVAS
jgi:ribulose-5-phosphate 4-epimerase/fuculose-1-phosphate aldolase